MDEDFEFRIPDCGDGIEEVLIGSWLLQDGEAVQEGQFLVEIETEKASQTLTSPVDGKLKILVPNGEFCKVGDVIANIGIATNQKPKPWKIFISYRREDSAAMAGRIFDRLEQHFGKDSIFMDIDAIPVGVDFRDFISSTLEHVSVMLIIMGDSWLCDRLEQPNDFVRLEIESAVNRSIPIVPVLVGSVGIPRPEELPDSIEPIAFRNAVRVDYGLDFSHHFQRLAFGIERLLNM